MKKSLICLVVAIATLACFLVLPILSVGGESYSFISLFGEASFEMLYSNMFTLAWLLALVVGIASLISAVRADRQAIIITSIAGAVLMFASYVSSVDVAAISAAGSSAFRNVAEFSARGIALWITTLGFVANAVLATVFKKNWR